MPMAGVPAFLETLLFPSFPFTPSIWYQDFQAKQAVEEELASSHMACLYSLPTMAGLGG